MKKAPIMLVPPSKYIFVTLRRFLQSFENGESIVNKIHTPIEINNTLNIPFINGPINYKIKGFISHLGDSPQEGHYYYTGKGDDRQWRVYNDTRIKNADYNDDGPYLDVGVEGTEKERVYILLYELADDAAVDAAMANVNIGALNRNMGRMSLTSASASASATANRSSKNNRKPNVTRGRNNKNKKTFTKEEAIKYLKSRGASLSPNARNRTISRIIRGQRKNAILTNTKIQELINKTRKGE